MSRSQRELIALNGMMGLALLFNLAAALYAAFALRPLFAEGVHWLYKILDTGRPFFDWQYLRYGDGLPQLPTILLTRFFGGGIPGGAPLLTFCLSYGLQPQVLLLISLVYLIWRGRPELIPIRIISFALASMPIAPAAQMIVQETIGVFWLALFILLLEPGENWRSSLILTSLLLLLSLTHESSFLFLCALGVVALIQARRRGFRSFLAWHLCLITGLAGWVAYRVLGPHAGGAGFFISDLRVGLDPFRWYTVLGTLIVLGALAVSHSDRIFNRRLTKAARVIVVLGTSAFMALDGFPGWLARIDFLNAKPARTTAIPIALALACLLAWFELKGRTREILARRAGGFLAVSATVFLICATAHDLRYTHSWEQGLSSFEAYLASLPAGCQNIEENDLVRYWSIHGLGSERLCLFSLVLQRTRIPTKILFVQLPNSRQACEDLRSRKRIDLFGTYYTEPRTCRGFLQCQPETLQRL